MLKLRFRLENVHLELKKTPNTECLHVSTCSVCYYDVEHGFLGFEIRLELSFG